MNDLNKVISIVSGIIAIGIFFNSSDFAYGVSDFTLEAGINRQPSNTVWEITKFNVSGDSGKQICPSGQCRVSTYGTNLNVIPPDPHNMGLYYDIDFRLLDNITNANLGPKKKEFVEQFTSQVHSCRVYDIIEKNGKELYYCRGDSALTRNFDSKTWYYDTMGIYDAKNNELKVYGNFTKTLPYYSPFEFK